ncbi:IS5 family transposase [Xenorhabdus japonica]|uniref:IS5 family transposase n=1 Tax=Xenorhabdus japonica TaxID=53341 RepID=UPI003BB6AC85
MRKAYVSDISREVFKEIAPLLLSGRKCTQPRKVDVYEMFCVLLYLLKSGCQWDMLPSDFPCKSTVYYYFKLWKEKPSETEPSLLEQALKNVVGKARTNRGRNVTTTCMIVDAQSVKNTDTAREKGYDAGKKVSGSKRHIAVDSQGGAHAITVTTANVTDKQGALTAFTLHKKSLTRVTNVLADGGYTGATFATCVNDVLGATVEIAKRSEPHTFKVIPKRWLVERSFAWLEKCPNLLKHNTKECDAFIEHISGISIDSRSGKYTEHPA